jgi:hypothetical protein
MTQSANRFAWILNLDAEFELARTGYAPPARLLSQLEQYGKDSHRLLGPADVLLSPSSAPSVAATELRPARTELLLGRAWCPTPRALSMFAARGIPPEPHPDVKVLARVNHRRFAFELGGGLEGQRYIESKAELDSELRRVAQSPRLLKRPLSFAGRGQLRVYAHAKITEKEWSWIEASLAHDGLIVEPLVVPTLEVSLHGFVWRDARFELGQVCTQDVSERGVYRGVRRARAGELTEGEHRALLAQGERVAGALANAGYFGPFGIDAHRSREAGFCPLSEINARYTMGFVTGFPRHPSELRL